MPNCAPTVSYTHLDVYKRQGLKNVRGQLAEYWGYIGERSLWGQGLGKHLMLAIEAQALAKRYTCLLYTSRCV